MTNSDNQKQIAIAIGVVLNDKGEVLLGTRNQPEIPHIHNKLEFPGGGIEFGEEPSQAVVREVKEETGLDVEVVRLLPKIYSNVWSKEHGGDQILLLAYHCKILGGELGTEDPEIGELKFFKPEDIDHSRTLPKTKEIIGLLTTTH